MPMSQDKVVDLVSRLRASAPSIDERTRLRDHAVNVMIRIIASVSGNFDAIHQARHDLARLREHLAASLVPGMRRKGRDGLAALAGEETAERLAVLAGIGAPAPVATIGREKIIAALIEKIALLAHDREDGIEILAALGSVDPEIDARTVRAIAAAHATIRSYQDAVAFVVRQHAAVEALAEEFAAGESVFVPEEIRILMDEIAEADDSETLERLIAGTVKLRNVERFARSLADDVPAFRDAV
jgi:hypothetical protein